MGISAGKSFRAKLVSGNVFLDMFKEEDVKVSNNITQLFDLGAVPSNFAQNFTLPATYKNNLFFENAYDISIDFPENFNTNQKVDAYLDFDGIYVVSGYIQLLKVNIKDKYIDSYEISLFGQVSKFNRDINLKFLTDLDELSIYNHTASIGNITASWSNELFSGSIVYPIADYGKRISYNPGSLTAINNPSGGLFVQDFKPAIKVKNVLDAIFTDLGYTYTSSFLNQTWFDDVYMICNYQGQYPIFAERNLDTFDQFKVRQFISDSLQDIRRSIPYNGNVYLTDIYNGQEYNYNNAYGAGQFYVPFTSSIDFTFNMSLEYGPTGSNPTGSGGPQFTIDFTNLTSSVVKTADLPNINSNIAIQVGRVTATAKTQIKQPETFKITLNGPAHYNAQLKSTALNAVTNFSSSLDFDNKNSSFFSLDSMNNAADGLVMDIPSNMPFGNSGIKYVDFIRGLQKKFNLVIYADKRNNNQFIIETFNEWYNRGVVRNFDQYVQTEEQIQVIPANTLAYQKLSFKDKSEVDYYGSLFKTQSNREFGQEFFVDTTNQFSQGEFKVETQFGSSPLVLPADTLLSGSTNVLEIPAFVANEQYKPATVFPRIFFYNGQRNVEGYYLFFTPNTSLSYNVAPHFGHYNNAIPTTGSRSLLFLNETPNFGTTPTESLYTKYWQTYISLLYNPKTRMINAKAVIPIADYFDIELNDVAFFRGNHYHIRAINNYSLQTGECDIILLGPVLPDTIAGAQYNVYPNPGEDSNYSQAILRPFYQPT
jgi:hypothetical protein